MTPPTAIFLFSFFLVSLAASSFGDEETTKPAPIVNPWDANQWETGSGKTFWRAQASTAKIESISDSAASPKPPAPKKTSSPVPFPSRQSEK